MKREWKIGDRWLTPNEHIFEVVESDLGDGTALLKMIYPIVTRPMTQKPIPESWRNITEECPDSLFCAPGFL